jgi:predicted RNA-binding protein with EMAP domain
MSYHLYHVFDKDTIQVHLHWDYLIPTDVIVDENEMKKYYGNNLQQYTYSPVEVEYIGEFATVNDLVAKAEELETCLNIEGNPWYNAYLNFCTATNWGNVVAWKKSESDIEQELAEALEYINLRDQETK